MNLTEEISEIVWHEIGHLCYDMILVNRIKNIKITEFQIHFDNNIEGKKWGGHIKIHPGPNPFEVISDVNFFGIKLLSLYSGCFFQGIYLKSILKKQFEINDCFCIKSECIGNKDFTDYNSLISKFTSHCDKKMSIRGNIEIFQYLDSFPKSLKYCDFFIKKVNKITSKLVIMIENDFREKGMPSKYIFQLKENELMSLIKKLKFLVFFFLMPQVLILNHKFKQKLNKFY